MRKWVNKKCEADFVYLIEGCGKTRTKINEGCLTLGIYARHRSAENARSQWNIPRMSVVRLSLCSENFHIFNQGRAKTLLICMCQLLNTTKLEKFPNTDNTHREH